MEGLECRRHYRRAGPEAFALYAANGSEPRFRPRCFYRLREYQGRHHGKTRFCWTGGRDSSARCCIAGEITMTQDKEPGGFGYDVSDEQLEAFGKLTLLQRLQWVEEAGLFTLMARTPETAERQERLRRGETIVPE